MLGYMTSKGWRLPRKDIEDFKLAFPEVDDKLIELCVDKGEKNG